MPTKLTSWNQSSDNTFDDPNTPEIIQNIRNNETFKQSLELCQALENIGLEDVMVAGGVLRDAAMGIDGKKASDIDIFIKETNLPDEYIIDQVRKYLNAFSCRKSMDIYELLDQKIDNLDIAKIGEYAGIDLERLKHDNIDTYKKQITDIVRESIAPIFTDTTMTRIFSCERLNDIDVQLIFHESPSTIEYIEHEFDFGICKAGSYSTGVLYFNEDEFINDITFSELNVRDFGMTKWSMHRSLCVHGNKIHRKYPNHFSFYQEALFKELEKPRRLLPTKEADSIANKIFRAREVAKKNNSFDGDPLDILLDDVLNS